MFYIHHTACISPQQTFLNEEISKLNESVDNKLQAVEPLVYENIPLSLLRRMGKAARLGVGAALPIISKISKLDGIVIGTGNGGMEDCIKFLNQIIDYHEGRLTPTNFVQSTANAIASQLGFLCNNKGYNITHVHRGLAFENAVIDAGMLIKEYPSNCYLLGGVDEISDYNYNIEYLDGWYKKELNNKDLYNINSPGSIAGEGSAMFIVNGKREGAMAQMQAISVLHSREENTVNEQLKHFLKANLKEGEEIDLFFSGENGDNRLLKFYRSCEVIAGRSTVARFKHMTGEFPSASASGLWLALHILQSQALPKHMVKSQGPQKEYRKILVYNNYKGAQHSFTLISGV